MTLSADLRVKVGTFALHAAFDAPHGITTLFGPSGAGKTMTLRAIAGLEPATGRLVVGERTLLDSERGIEVRPRHRRVGFVFQHYALFPHLSVAGNIAYGIHSLGAEERHARVAELLALVHLEDVAAHRPAQLSGGQQQRVALARALATRPALLLLDEPFAAVDLRVRRRLRAELRRIHDAVGTPMILVTHDLAEVRQLSDRVVLIEKGETVGAGTVEELRDDPLFRELAAEG